MPKLIDVEKLEEYKVDCCVSLTQWQEGWDDAIDTITGDTPTVEAIPVEWLKQWEEKHKDDPCYCKFVSEEILADWEKENEANVER